jgi:hypothetical protein
LARKLLNIFLRDAFYDHYLRQPFHLGRAERYLELPMDSVIAKRMRKEARGYSLPSWRGVKRLSPGTSDQYQRIASRLATRQGTARVHLDAFWWGTR